MSTLLSVGFIPTAALADDVALSDQQATVDAVMETTDTDTTEADIALDSTIDEALGPTEPTIPTEGEAYPTPNYTEPDPSLDTVEVEITTPVDENVSSELGIEYPSSPEFSSDNETISVVEELPTEIFFDEIEFASISHDLTNSNNEITLDKSIENTLFNENANYSNVGFNLLTPFEKYIYLEIKSLAQDIAAGNREYTEFTIDVSNYVYQEYPKLFEGMSADKHYDEVDKAEKYVNYSMGNAMRVLRYLDCPHELYWLSQSYITLPGTDCLYPLHDIESDQTSDSYKITSWNVTSQIPIEYKYKAKDQHGIYEDDRIDTNAIKDAYKAITRAQAIVDQYVSLSDYEKLNAYKDWICENVSYDNRAFGDHEQIIYAFDDDPNTNVVCEGYARAFQYLCDLSTFQNPSTKCYYVAGKVKKSYGNENHAWNIVTLTDEDGIPRNYLVDTTWIDGGWSLFLKGAESGNIQDGFTLNCNYGDVVYSFTDPYETYNLASVDVYGSDSSSILNLSSKDYFLLPSPENPSEPDDNPEPDIPDSPYEPEPIQIGWVQNGNTWYFYNNNGVKLTGWQQISGVWYYFNSDGAMTTGWTQIGGAWYYLTPSGAMATGWQRIGGTWYYLKSSGAMATGWQQIGGVWYYLNGSGAMQTGWYKVGPKWYYSNTSGTMQSNRWIGNYYVGSSGAMATSQWVGPYYVDASGLWVR